MGKDNSEPIPAPEDNVKPLNYKEQFSVRSCLSTALKFIIPLRWAGAACHLGIY